MTKKPPDAGLDLYMPRVRRWLSASIHLTPFQRTYIPLGDDEFYNVNIKLSVLSQKICILACYYG
jgi:hypothetical protein